MKLHNAVIGFIAGDMFGLPYEFSYNNTNISQKFIGYGTHNQPPYTWSDDTAFLLATYFHKDKHPKELREEYKKVLEGKYFQEQKCFDVGYSTKNGLIDGVPISSEEGGNGFIGRCIPYLLQGEFNTPIIIGNIYLTHSSKINILAGLWYLDTLHRLLKGKKVRNISLEYKSFFSFTKGALLLDNSFTAIGAVNRAFKAFENSTSLLNGFQSICREGGDTDSVCALFGSLWCSVNEPPKKLTLLIQKEVQRVYESIEREI